MRSFLARFFYLFIKYPSRFGYFLYYKRWQREGYEAFVDPSLPTIFVANHQNALSDPMNMVLAVDSNRRPWFLTRADIFRPALLPVFRFMRMMPIYRTKDKVDVMKANEQTFERCVQYLLDRDCIGIFPEGSHLYQNHIRPLKKGLARIAFSAAERSHFQLPIRIVTLGHYYQDAKSFKKGLLLHTGPPVEVEKYYELYQKNPQKALLELTKAVQQNLRENTLHISRTDKLNFIEDLRAIFHPELTAHAPEDLLAELAAGQLFVEKIENWLAHTDEETIQLRQAETTEYLQLLQALKLRNHTLAHPLPGPTVRWLQGVALAFGAPFFVLGLLLNYLPYRLASDFPAKKFKDDHFFSSIRALTGLFYFGGWYLILAIGATLVTGTTIAGFTLAVFGVFSGEMAWHWRSAYKKWQGRRRLAKLDRRDSARLLRARLLRANLAKWALSETH